MNLESYENLNIDELHACPVLQATYGPHGQAPFGTLSSLS
jgi:hypothetical protein